MCGRVTLTTPTEQIAAQFEVPDPPLPDSVRHRRKTGFSTPLGRWLQDAAGTPRQPGIDLSAASRTWALNVWRAGWTGPVAA